MEKTRWGRVTTLNLTIELVNKIQKIIDEGIFFSRSELVRCAVYDFLIHRDIEIKKSATKSRTINIKIGNIYHPEGEWKEYHIRSDV